MTTIISKFDEEHRFLSNFYPSPLQYRGLEFPTVEHAYQAAKSVDIDEVLRIRDAATPKVAKRLGRKANLVWNWEQTKIGIMIDLIELKFVLGSDLAARLMATAPADLIEGNYWHDTYWGRCTCDAHADEGKNVLGTILMTHRSLLLRDRSA